MRIVDRGIIFDGTANADCQSCTFPQICVLPNGRWLCSFRAATVKAKIADNRPLVVFSDDQGKTWSHPAAPFAAAEVDGRPGVFRMAAFTPMGGERVLCTLLWVDASNPDLPFFNEQTEGLLDCQIFFSWSQDNGQRWSGPELMRTLPFDVPTPITGSVLALADGTLACQAELNKHYHDTRVWHHRSVLIFSRDGGKSWSDYVNTSCDPENRIFYWDQRPNVLADGRILDTFWTYDNRAAVYLNIHARQSLDHGMSWSDMWDTGLPGQPAPPVSLPDGSVALVYVDRTAATKIKMRISGDMGRTWPEGTELMLYEGPDKTQTVAKAEMNDAWTEMGAFSVGLPDTAPMSNGDLLVVYYAGPETDRTAIEWVRLTRSE